MDDGQLERLAGGRVWAPTGAMRYVAMALIAVVIVLVMVGMAWLTIS